jgi:hypothetical protein
MKKYILLVGLGIFWLVFSCPLSGQAQDAANPAAALPETAPPIKEIAPGVFEIGGVRIIKKENRVEFPAQVNMANGLLEYLLVGAGGKLHESLLKTDIEPFNLQVALLLLGLEVTAKPLREQGDPAMPQGDPVNIWVTAQKGDIATKLRIEEWVVIKDNAGATSPMGQTDFIFTGSIVNNGVFMAQLEKSIVAVYHDPVAMIDNPAPLGGSDDVWYVNQQSVLPVGTNVIISIQTKKGRKQ